MSTIPQSVIRTDYERLSQADWDAKTQDPINLLLGKDDGLYHHHFAVCDFDRRVLDGDGEQRESAILAEMHRMETDQVDLIVEGLGPLPAGAHVMDSGSGRGGTSFIIARSLRANVTGVNFCRHHIEFAEQIARERGWSNRVGFHFANMADTQLPDNNFDAVVTNETTMYVDLDEVFAEFARLVRPGGRYVLVTWCRNDLETTNRDAIDAIDAHYVCHIHDRSHYFAMLARHHFVPLTVQDLTADAIPYWELRSHSRYATGVETPFLTSLSSHELNYMVIVTELSR